MGQDGLQRVCFELKVKPECIGEYRRRHAEVWPEMLLALQEAGWHNYSLFLRSDGLLIGYVEVNSLEDVQRRMAETAVNARWQEQMSGFFENSEGAPDENMVTLEEVFNLESQLAKL